MSYYESAHWRNIPFGSLLLNTCLLKRYSSIIWFFGTRKQRICETLQIIVSGTLSNFSAVFAAVFCQFWCVKRYEFLQKSEISQKTDYYKTGVINDPLGQAHSLASSEHWFCCYVFLNLKSGDERRTDGRTDRQTDGRTTCAKTIIPTGPDFRLAEWINLN